MNSKKDKISDIKDDNNINKIDKENNNLYLKVQNIIKNAKMEKYISDREKISVEGISFGVELQEKIIYK